MASFCDVFVLVLSLISTSYTASFRNPLGNKSVRITALKFIGLFYGENKTCQWVALAILKLSVQIKFFLIKNTFFNGHPLKSFMLDFMMARTKFTPTLFDAEVLQKLKLDSRCVPVLFIIRLAYT